jgi:uncharacterized membrane protein
MSIYLTVKWIHILSSVVLVGTGFGSAYYMFFVNRSKNIVTQAIVSKLVVRADWWFTSPTVVLQPVTGLYLAHLSGWPLTTPWLAASIGLFLFAGICWLPVVWLQIRMAATANNALQKDCELPDIYSRYARYWEYLGYPAFIAMLMTFYLMVAKPTLY